MTTRDGELDLLHIDLGSEAEHRLVVPTGDPQQPLELLFTRIEQYLDRATDDPIEHLGPFARALREERSSGSTLLSFLALARRVIGDSAALSPGQKQTLSAAITLSEERSVTAVRWTTFVERNLDSPRWLGIVLDSAISSMRRLEGRLAEAVAHDEDHLAALPDSLDVTVVGHTTSAGGVLRGLRRRTRTPLRVRYAIIDGSPRPSQESIEAFVPPDTELSTVNLNEVIREGMNGGDVDILVMGSKVVGRSDRRRVEVVNSSPVVRAARAAANVRIPIMVASGLYKIWPTEFYRAATKANLFDTRETETANGILHGESISWIVTEFGVLRPRELTTAAYMRPFFEVPQTELAAFCMGWTSTEDEARAFVEHDEIMEKLTRLDEGIGPRPPAKVPMVAVDADADPDRGWATIASGLARFAAFVTDPPIERPRRRDDQGGLTALQLRLVDALFIAIASMAFAAGAVMLVAGVASAFLALVLIIAGLTWLLTSLMLVGQLSRYRGFRLRRGP